MKHNIYFRKKNVMNPNFSDLCLIVRKKTEPYGHEYFTKNMYCITSTSVVTILEFLTSIRYLEKYRYSIPFSIPGREKNCHTIKGVNFFFFLDKYNMTMRYILHEQKCLEVVHLFKV